MRDPVGINWTGGMSMSDPSPVSWSRSQVACAVVLASLAAFLGLQIAAAAAYPGGTFCDAHVRRYLFWGNYVCDVMQPRAPDGAANAGAALLGTLSFAAIAVGFVPFWWLVGALVGRGAGVAVRILGVLSAAATFVVARVPSGRWPLLHVGAVFTAAIPGLAAAVIGAVALLRAGRRLAGALGIVTLSVAAVNAAGYGRAVLHGVRCNPSLPVVQKLAALALLAWMTTVAVQGARRAGPGGGAG